MLLPTKHLLPQRALLSVSARVLRHITYRITPAELWETYQSAAEPQERITFDWFVLALDVLFAIGAIVARGNKIERRR